MILPIDIVVRIRSRKQAVAPSVRAWGEQKPSSRQNHLQTQMLIMMVRKIVVFLLFTLPFSIFKVITPRSVNITTSISRSSSIQTLLGWFLSLNYGVSLAFELSEIDSSVISLLEPPKPTGRVPMNLHS